MSNHKGRSNKPLNPKVIINEIANVIELLGKEEKKADSIYLSVQDLKDMDAISSKQHANGHYIPAKNEFWQNFCDIQNPIKMGKHKHDGTKPYGSLFGMPVWAGSQFLVEKTLMIKSGDQVVVVDLKDKDI